MVTLPKDFVATKYPGYFWNIADNRLYSVKVTGALKPLKMSKANQWNHGIAGWKISVNGRKRYLALDFLKKLKPAKSTFPIWDQLELI